MELLGTDMHTGRILEEYHVNIKAQIEVVQLKNKEHWRLPENHGKLEEMREIFFLQPSEGINPADTLIPDSQIPELGQY